MKPPWLLLIISLPTQKATGRMRVWRALKALGCSVLRDGVYLLPNRPEFRQDFQVQAEEVRACGGNAHILLLESEDQEQQSLFEALFDRSDDYAKLLEIIRKTSKELDSVDVGQAQRLALRLRKDFEIVARLDFFQIQRVSKWLLFWSIWNRPSASVCHRMSPVQCNAGLNCCNARTINAGYGRHGNALGSTGSPAPG